ncbi:hypothetical protein O185_22260 [Photorhabdus temperata J3]|uniref:Uncharacterized protein n=1 Tax=Photorhabdus temperata J3 TaxID=1389415 RepID=U7QWS5_PHOTE|nr:hypothetical protein O185_22260 [Photorhabdus temperata J3]
MPTGTAFEFDARGNSILHVEFFIVILSGFAPHASRYQVII